MPAQVYCLQIIGIVLAVLSGVLIGSSFVFKKKGLLRSQAGHAAGEGVAYLKSVSNSLPQPVRHVINIPYQAIMVDRHDKSVSISYSLY